MDFTTWSYAGLQDLHNILSDEIRKARRFKAPIREFELWQEAIQFELARRDKETTWAW